MRIIEIKNVRFTRNCEICGSSISLQVTIKEDRVQISLICASSEKSNVPLIVVTNKEEQNNDEFVIKNESIVEELHELRRS